MNINPSQSLPQFFCKPCWRWDRAVWLTQQSKRLSRQDDVWVRQAKAALSKRTRDANSIPESAAECALRLWHDEVPAEWRWKLEAFLLTNASLEEVSSFSETPLEVAEAYHEIFFHVRPFLHLRDWVMSQVIGRSWDETYGNVPVGVIWKYAGYMAGPPGVQAMISETAKRPTPAWLRELFSGARPCNDERDRAHSSPLNTAEVIRIAEDIVAPSSSPVYGRPSSSLWRRMKRRAGPHMTSLVNDVFK